MRSLRCVWALTVLVVGTLAADIQAGNAQEPLPQQQSVPMQERVDRLTAALARTEIEMDGLRREIEALRSELHAAGKDHEASPPYPSGKDAEAIEQLQEEHEIVSAEVKQHEQTKVESESKFPVRITGMVLFNAFSNAGVVDEIDLPTSALLRTPGQSHGSVGGTLRQTWIGLEGRGPVLGSLHTSARVDMDFFGGQTYSLASGPASTARLRTAAVRAESRTDVLEARLDAPLISPLNPTSLASVAQPALAWAGNLWTWAPELRWQHSFLANSSHTFDVEAGLRDPYLANAGQDTNLRIVSPGESNRKPAYEGRISYGSPQTPGSQYGSSAEDLSQGWRVGVGGYYGRQIYSDLTRVNTWAVTGDWYLPLQRWLRLSGEAYKGTGLGGLGGGAYRDVVQGTDPISGIARTLGLDAAGGWVQMQVAPSYKLQINGSLGQDAGSGRELRSLIAQPFANPLGYYARNRAVIANVFYRPWSSVVLSPEFRHIVSWPTSGQANVANVFTLSAGYHF